MSTWLPLENVNNLFSLLRDRLAYFVANHKVLRFCSAYTCKVGQKWAISASMLQYWSGK